jgi:hypothetical protein
MSLIRSGFFFRLKGWPISRQIKMPYFSHSKVLKQQLPRFTDSDSSMISHYLFYYHYTTRQRRLVGNLLTFKSKTLFPENQS